MKKAILILIMSCAIISCSLDSKSSSEYTDPIVGTWVWQSSTGGIAGTTETPASTGVQKKLVFTKEGRMISYTDNVETANIPFEIKIGKSIYSEKNYYLIYSGENLMEVILSFDTGNMQLGDNFFDGYVSIYKK